MHAYNVALNTSLFWADSQDIRPLTCGDKSYILLFPLQKKYTNKQNFVESFC